MSPNNDIRDIVMEIQKNQIEMMNILYDLKNEVTSISQSQTEERKNFMTSLTSSKGSTSKKPNPTMKHASNLFNKTLSDSGLSNNFFPTKSTTSTLGRFASTENETDLLETFSHGSSDDDDDEAEVDELRSVSAIFVHRILYI